MEKVLRLLSCFLFVTAGLAPSASGQSYKVGGTVFGDYYWVASHHLDDLEGRNGFWMRRIYLTVDQRFDEAWSVRLRGEMNQSGDFTSKASPAPYLKDAYVRWQNASHQVHLGLAPTPAWAFVEEVWGYRPVERTAVDLQKLGGARDLGVSVMGRLGGAVRYHAMVGNGSGLDGEIDRGKKFAFALGVSPVRPLTFEAYGDYEDRPGETDRYTVQAFLAYRTAGARFGVQLARQMREVAGAADQALMVGSVFGVVKVGPAVHTFLRYDRLFNPNPDGEKIAYLPFDPNTRASVLVGGVDVGAASERVHFIPNVEVVLYDPVEGRTIRPDVIPRMTFSIDF